MVIFIALAAIFVALFWFLAYALLLRRRRTVALVIAAISCLGIPFGTILGALTIFTLVHPEIQSEFR